MAPIRTPEPPPHPGHSERRIRDDIREGLHFVVRHPILRKVVACTGTSNLFTSMLTAVEIPFTVRSWVFFSPLRRMRDVPGPA